MNSGISESRITQQTRVTNHKQTHRKKKEGRMNVSDSITIGEGIGSSSFAARQCSSPPLQAREPAVVSQLQFLRLISSAIPQEGANSESPNCGINNWLNQIANLFITSNFTRERESSGLQHVLEIMTVILSQIFPLPILRFPNLNV